MIWQILGIIISLLLAPLLQGIINKTKAFFGGRKGQPVLQAYYDIIKLLNKGTVYSSSTTWIFKVTPVVCLAAMITVLLLLPFGDQAALISFKGDIILFIYILALARFVTVIAALDTGSSFEGMGASREVFYSAIAEPAFLVAFAGIACKTAGLTLSVIPEAIYYKGWFMHADINLLLVVTFFILTLSENCRVPFDDPNTHLELTMIHEVIILDYSGPDLGFMLYAASLKLWIFISIIIMFAVPSFTHVPILSLIIYVVEIFVVAVVIGVVESIIARMNFLKVPLMLLLATVLSLLSLILILRS